MASKTEDEASPLPYVGRSHLLADWHEDIGPALWWVLPLREPPWVGTPLDSDWPDYHTHWTPLIVPDELCRESAP
jgi:hypothetical protein